MGNNEAALIFGWILSGIKPSPPPLHLFSYMQSVLAINVLVLLLMIIVSLIQFLLIYLLMTSACGSVQANV